MQDDKLCIFKSVAIVSQKGQHHACHISASDPYEDGVVLPSIIGFIPNSEMLSLAAYRRQAQLRNQKKSVFFRWLTMAVLVVNLIACLALINMIHQQNEIDKFGIGEHKMRSVEEQMEKSHLDAFLQHL